MSRSSHRFTLEDASKLPLKNQQEIAAQLFMDKLPPISALAPDERKRLNAAYAGAGLRKSTSVLAPGFKPPTPKPRLRQSRDKLNKLELAYQGWLNQTYGPEKVLSQAIRLRLGNGIWYKADFFVPYLALFIEVKGPWKYRGGFENLKVAASLHTWAKFRLVWREKGVWHAQEILP